ncbi:transposase [Ruegeria arenilitoris]|uniref:transposase n=1 Tax=Ruegeria arenilitoris TaxID=1173585 RepID=UPI00147F86C9
MKVLITGKVVPQAGDLVLARVVELGKQTRVELTDGRRAHLFPGDEIVVAYGNRYAPDQFEAIVSTDLSPCDLVAAGGIAGLELNRHIRMRHPTQIEPVGLIGRSDGCRINLRDYRVDASEKMPAIPGILSLGTSMNAGKTLTAASTVRGLKRQGYRVAALKITGTGSGGDIWIVRDAGADFVADFTDAGFGSTYLTPIDDVVSGALRLMNAAAAKGCDIAVIEIADGLEQLETRALIRHERLLGVMMGTLFSAFDSMGAVHGVNILHGAGHHLFGTSGRIGMSPLGVREAENATGLRHFSPIELQEAALVPAIRRRAAELQAIAKRQKKALRRIAGEMVGLELADVIHTPFGVSPTAIEPSAIEPENAPDSAAENNDYTRSRLARDILRLAADHVMEAEIKDVQSKKKHRAAPRKAGNGAKRGRPPRRNGYYSRKWETPFGDVWLRVPRLRDAHYLPGFFDRKLKSEAVVAVLLAIGTDVFETVLARLVTFLSSKVAPRVGIDTLQRDILALNPIAATGMNRGHVRRALDANEAPASYLVPVDDDGWDVDFHPSEFPDPTMPTIKTAAAVRARSEELSVRRLHSDLLKTRPAGPASVAMSGNRAMKAPKTAGIIAKPNR